MAMKHGFNDEDKEEASEKPNPKGLNEAAHVDKITMEAWVKVMVHRKSSALTAAPKTTPSAHPRPLPHRPPQTTPAPQTAATLDLALALAPAIH
jgi:hypothetical protein